MERPASPAGGFGARDVGRSADDQARRVRAALALRFARRGDSIEVELVEVGGAPAIECAPRGPAAVSRAGPKRIRFPVTDEARRVQVGRMVLALESLGWVGGPAPGGTEPGGRAEIWCAPD